MYSTDSKNGVVPTQKCETLLSLIRFSLTWVEGEEVFSCTSPYEEQIVVSFHTLFLRNYKGQSACRMAQMAETILGKTHVFSSI